MLGQMWPAYIPDKIGFPSEYLLLVHLFRGLHSGDRSINVRSAGLLMRVGLKALWFGAQVATSLGSGVG